MEKLPFSYVTVVHGRSNPQVPIALRCLVTTAPRPRTCQLDRYLIGGGVAHILLLGPATSG